MASVIGGDLPSLEGDQMILILLVPVIGIWLFIAISLGTRIPKWLGLTRYQAASKVAVVALIFVAPVADEIIAYPQFRALCKRCNKLLLLSYS